MKKKTNKKVGIEMCCLVVRKHSCNEDYTAYIHTLSDLIEGGASKARGWLYNPIYIVCHRNDDRIGLFRKAKRMASELGFQGAIEFLKKMEKEGT